MSLVCSDGAEIKPYISGNPVIGKNVSIGFWTEINAKGAIVIIGDNCDIASFVAINAADSHKRCLGLSDEIEREDITLENNVFIGSHCFIGGGTYIGHHSVIAAGEIVIGKTIPPYSLVVNGKIKEGYYEREFPSIHHKEKTKPVSGSSRTI